MRYRKRLNRSLTAGGVAGSIKTFRSRFKRQPGLLHFVQMSSKRRNSPALVVLSSSECAKESSISGGAMVDDACASLWASGTTADGFMGGTSSGTVLCCSARIKSSWILLMASFHVLRLLLNYCDPFLPRDDSSCAKALLPSLWGPRYCAPQGEPWDPIGPVQIHEQLHAQRSAELASPDRRKN